MKIRVSLPCHSLIRSGLAQGQSPLSLSLSVSQLSALSHPFPSVLERAEIPIRLLLLHLTTPGHIQKEQRRTPSGVAAPGIRF